MVKENVLYTHTHTHWSMFRVNKKKEILLYMIKLINLEDTVLMKQGNYIRTKILLYWI